MADTTTTGFTKQETNYYRSVCALLNVGTPVLRKLLTFKADTLGITNIKDLLQDTSNRSKFQRMNSRQLPRYQLELLYPADGREADVDEWDITMLCLVLDTIFSLSNAERNNVNKLRSLRNSFYAHKSEAAMDDVEFESVWRNIETTIDALLADIRCDAFSETMRQNLCRIRKEHVETNSEFKRQIEMFLFHEDVIERVDELTDVVKNMCEKVDEMGQQVARSLDANEARGNMNDNMMKDKLRNHLLGEYNNINVGVAPLLNQTEDMDVYDLYTDLTISDITEKNKFEPSLRSTDHVRVHRYKELFSHRPSKRPNQVFLVGNAGSGKSTYCRRIVSTWCSAVRKSIETRQQLTDDEKETLQFDLLFYIALCDVQACNSVEDMIREVIFRGAMSNVYDAVLENLRSADNKCLLIFDGFDEWENQDEKQVKGLFSFNCMTIVTTRHWALERIPKYLQSRLLEIEPMDECSTKILIGNVLHHFYNFSKNRLDHKVEQFLHQLRQNRLMGIVEIPLMLTYFVCIWFEESGLYSSQTINYGGVLEHLIKYAEARDKSKSSKSLGKELNDKHIILPGPMSFRRRCNSHGFVLIKLGCFAFEALLCEPVITLIYDFDELKKRIGTTALETGLNIGILSKRQLEGKLAHARYSVQFLHRSLQEFLAALWLTSPHSVSAVDSLLAGCQTIETLLQLQNVFEYMCGMQPSLYNKLAKFIVNMASNSDEVQTYRHSIDGMYSRRGAHINTFHVVKEIQDILLATFNEANQNRKYVGHRGLIQQHHKSIWYGDEAPLKFCIQDLIVDNDTESEVGKVLCNHSLKSLYVEESEGRTEEIRTQIRQSKSLERLHLDTKTSKFFQEIPASSMRHMRSLSLTFRRLDSLPDQFQHMQHLSALCLSVTGTHATIRSLKTYFKTSKSLTEIDIEEVTCTDHSGPSEDCKFMFDLHLNKHLKRLSIDKVSNGNFFLVPGMGLEDVCMHGRMHNPLVVLHCLQYSHTLTHLTLGDLLLFRLFEWNENDVKAIMKVIPTLTMLRYLHLMGIEFYDSSLVLALECSTIEVVYLEDVYMCNDSWKRFLCSLLKIQDKRSRTSILLRSQSIDNDVVIFVNETERFENVIFTSKHDGCLVTFDCC